MLYDEEMMIKDVAALFKANLNAEIDLINTEKNDLLVLEHIANDKYIFETLGESLLNFKGFFVLYGLMDTPLKDASTGNVIEDIVISFQIATFDNGEKERSNTLYKLLRYRRALRSIILKNPDVFRGYAKASMASLKPNAFPFDARAIVLTVGIDIKASVTAH